MRTHYRIHVYDNAAPPLGTPREVSLCPSGRGLNEPLSNNLQLIDCPACVHFIHQLGIDNFR